MSSSSSSSSPSPQLNELILNYLTQSAFPNSSKSFLSILRPPSDAPRSSEDVTGTTTVRSEATSTPTKAEQGNAVGLEDEDRLLLTETTLRREILDHILSGKIQAAIHLINRHFPLILEGSPSSTSSTTAPRSATPSTGSTGNADRSRPSSAATSATTTTTGPAAFDPRTFFLPSSHSIPPSSTASTTPPTPILHHTKSATSPTSIHSLTASPLILRPTILSINLQIQYLVEVIRNASAVVESTPSSPDAATSTYTSMSNAGGSDSPSPPYHSNGNGSSSNNNASVDPMSLSTSSIASARTTYLAQAIADGRALSTQVQMMENPLERERYAMELQNVAAMMAYPDLWSSPLAHYLDQGRREGLADLCNAAMLVNTNRTATPALELIVRQTTAVWTALVEAKVGYPGSDPKDKNRKMLPPFDLHTFLVDPDSDQAIGKAHTNGGASL